MFNQPFIDGVLVFIKDFGKVSEMGVIFDVYNTLPPGMEKIFGVVKPKEELPFSIWEPAFKALYTATLNVSYWTTSRVDRLLKSL